MNVSIENSLAKLTNAGLLLIKEFDLKYLIHIIVEETIDLGYCDLSSLYLNKELGNNNCNLSLAYKKGKFDVPAEFKHDNILIDFLKENRESVVLLERKKSPFIDLLINKKMQSGIVLPLIKEDLFLGALFLNSVLPYHFNREKINILDSFMHIAGEIFNYSRLINDLKAYFNKILK